MISMFCGYFFHRNKFSFSLALRAKSFDYVMANASIQASVFLRWFGTSKRKNMIQHSFALFYRSTHRHTHTLPQILLFFVRNFIKDRIHSSELNWEKNSASTHRSTKNQLDEDGFCTLTISHIESNHGWNIDAMLLLHSFRFFDCNDSNSLWCPHSTQFQ